MSRYEKAMANLMAGGLLRRWEVAELVGVCQSTVFKWGKKGKIHVVKLGRCVRYRSEDVSKLIVSRSGIFK